MITTAKGTIMSISDVASPAVYASISQCRTITGPTTKPKIVDVTAHSTPGYWMAKLAVLIDPGEVSFEFNFDIADATHAYATGMWNQMVGLIDSGFQMTFPNAAGVLTFKGYVGQHEFSVPVDNVLAVKMQFAITSSINAVP